MKPKRQASVNEKRISAVRALRVPRPVDQPYRCYENRKEPEIKSVEAGAAWVGDEFQGPPERNESGQYQGSATDSLGLSSGMEISLASSKTF